MPSKRKLSNFIVEDDEDHLERESESVAESDQEVKKSKNKSKSKSKSLKNDPDDEGDESNSPLVKKISKKDKLKTVKKPRFTENENENENENSEAGAGTTSIVRTTSDGDKYLDLGKKRRATVRAFKGMPLLDIREFWGADDNDLKPGKKGISLSVDQWEAIKRSAPAIDALFAQLKK